MPVASETDILEAITTKLTFLLGVHVYIIQLCRNLLDVHVYVIQSCRNLLHVNVYVIQLCRNLLDVHVYLLSLALTYWMFMYTY